ncbi:MAG: protein translocase subunit SecD [Propionibacteriaceae bacterium]
MATTKKTAKKRKVSQPIRTLLAFFLAVAALIAAMGALRTWTPRLGLDLRGGTTVTLTARNSDDKGGVNQENMELAKQIIQRRIDGLGVGETSVALSGDREIVISVPQMQQDQLLNMVGKTAQLTFRQVLADVPLAEPAATPSAESTPAVDATPAPNATPTAERRLLPMLPTAPPGAPTPRPSAAVKDLSMAEATAYVPTEQDASDFMAYKCGDDFPDVADQALITCDKNRTRKYFLSPVLIKGDTLKEAVAGVPQNQLNWQVNLTFKPEGAELFGQATTALSQQQAPKNMLGIVLDGDVISSPSVSKPILGGQAEITGSFNQKSANELANVLKYGALPLNFDVSSVDNISPTLGSDQLRAGLIAGAIGLGLVILYSLLYYRALSVVVVASLTMAGLLTYTMLTLLGAGFDLALSLPGIAGAIVAIGITADSFIIYFERIRDEVREGRSLRAAIQSGWSKARSTIIVADSVSLLSALVLFLLAIGAVKGFAFTLGLTTLIDLAIVFFFTHPLMTLLGETKFFGEGHKFSGLDPEHMGVEKVTATPVRRAPVRTTTSSNTEVADETKEA